MYWRSRTRGGAEVSSGPTTARRQVLVCAGFCILGAGAVGVTAGGRSEASGRNSPTTSPASRRAVDRRAVSRVHTSAPVMALTFDDGPDPDFTPAVLDVLGKYDVRATFFVIGRNAAKHPDLIQKMLREGHVVANHTQDHLWLNELDRDGIRDQVIGGLTTLGAIGAQGSSMFRPPRGWTSPTVADVVNGAGLRSVFWSDCIEARLSHGVRPAAEALVGQSGPGSIILCHDGGSLDGPNPQHIDRSRTVGALGLMLRGLRGNGLRPVVLPELLRAGRPV